MLSAALVVFALTGPPVDLGADYQLGGAYRPAEGVGVVARDRRAQPASGAYSICYVNAFQAQPGARRWWLSRHPDLVLRSAGKPIVDKNWGELLLDTGTKTKRKALPASSAAGSTGAAVLVSMRLSPTTSTPGSAARDCFDVVTTWLSRSFS